MKWFTCYGGKMFWWNKNHPSAVYTDNRNGHVRTYQKAAKIHRFIFHPFRKELGNVDPIIGQQKGKTRWFIFTKLT